MDGDTIEIEGQRIRLHGIDAPESYQQCQTKYGKLYDCGGNATRALGLLVEGQTVRCEKKDRDRYGFLRQPLSRLSSAGVSIASRVVHPQDHILNVPNNSR